MAKQKVFLSEADVEELRELLRTKKYTRKELAERYNVSYPTICNYTKELPSHKGGEKYLTADERLFCQKMINRGVLSRKELAMYFQVSQATIYRYTEACTPIKKHYSDLNSLDIEIIHILNREYKYSARKIAQTQSLPYNSVLKVLKDANFEVGRKMSKAEISIVRDMYFAGKKTRRELAQTFSVSPRLINYYTQDYN